MNKVIAYGRRSELFQEDQNTILKLYDANFSKERIHQEYRKTLCVWKSSKLNVPKPIREVTRDGKAGIVFEKIEGISLMDLFQKKPWLYLSYIPKITDVHKAVNHMRLTGLPNQKDEFTNLIQSTTRITTGDKTRLLQILNRKHQPVLCHGDFHHGNLIQTKSGQIYVLDWMDSFIGNYQLDVALTAVNACVSTAPDHVPYIYRQAYEVLKQILRLDKRYLRSYSLKDVNEYLFLAAAIHMARYDGDYKKSHMPYYQKSKGLLNLIK